MITRHKLEKMHDEERKWERIERLGARDRGSPRSLVDGYKQTKYRNIPVHSWGSSTR